jgi:hypothetical protein
MMDERLLALRADLYRVAGEYTRARMAYHSALVSQDLPATVNEAVVTCHEWGARYMAALDAVLGHLAGTESTSERNGEVDRAQRLKELVVRELDLITPG